MSRAPQPPSRYQSSVGEIPLHTSAIVHESEDEYVPCPGLIGPTISIATIPFLILLYNTSQDRQYLVTSPFNTDADHLATINSTVSLQCRHTQWSSCRLMQRLSSDRRHTHHHRHVRIFWASGSFQVPNDDITEASGIHNAFYSLHR
ncbi:hypothetical protein PoB_006820000 [Plakobranchus ocellatus]|uniref:Uncharacterized protein n=1 Tax=Plakobranchus ocellatus TaxID=259542 RepID=A0AAV4DC89_9GAST|nr:hypothetical protein PoB_006820000 [Plakobranchus ocellatus]